MKIFRVIIVLFFSSFTVIAQDSVPFPKEHIPNLLELKANLNTPLAKFPIIQNDDLFNKNFGEIEIMAHQVKDSLELWYLQHYSGTNKEVKFDDYFKLTALVNNFIPYDEIDIEVDSTKSFTIITNRTPEMDQGIGFSSDSISHTLDKSVRIKAGDEIDKNGVLNVKIKYLTGYDTIRLHRDQIGENFELRNKKYRLENILNGNLYIKVLDSVHLREGPAGRMQDDLNQRDIKYITFKNHQKTYTPSSEGFFRNSLKISSGLLNDKLSLLSDNEYQEYLSKFIIIKNEFKVDLLIFRTDLDYDMIWLLLPKYDYLFQTLNSKIRPQEVDNMKVVRYSFGIDEEVIKETEDSKN